MDVTILAATTAVGLLAALACLALCRRAEAVAAKAVEFADAAELDAVSARSERQRVKALAEQTAECAEVVRTEVAKLETLVARLNRERAENPPFVSITYSEETGDPVVAEVGAEKVCNPGSPFPCCQIPQPAVIEGGE